MSVLREVDSRPSVWAPDNTHYLVVCRVGSGPLGTLQEGTRGLNPPTRCG
jgi:hypothetical protein